MFFLFKQKTAYELRISDWSSDVGSSDLGGDRHRRARDRLVHLSCRDVEAAGLKTVLLRKQEPRVTSGNAQNPGLLLSQEHKVAPPTRADARCGRRPSDEIGRAHV